MPLDYLIEDVPAYISRGRRILSVLNNQGSFEILPGRPDVEANASQLRDESFDPDIGFDPNSYSRMDKFDGLEVGQELIDGALDVKRTETQGIVSNGATTEEK